MTRPFTFAVSAGALSDLSREDLAILMDVLNAAAGALADRVHEYDHELRALAPSIAVRDGIREIERALDSECERVTFERELLRRPQEGRRASGSD